MRGVENECAGHERLQNLELDVWALAPRHAGYPRELGRRVQSILMVGNSWVGPKEQSEAQGGLARAQSCLPASGSEQALLILHASRGRGGVGRVHWANSPLRLPWCH